MALFRPVLAADGEDDARRCVSLRSIDKKDIVDNRTVILRRDPGPDIVMHLRRDCPQLRYHNTFYFQRDAVEICAGFDWITTRSGSACLIERLAIAPKPAKPAPEPGAQ
ncbi:MAG: DUF6491 family protein [Rhodothalassiaceae bacterium]